MTIPRASNDSLNNSVSNTAHAWLQRGGDMAERIRAFDWSKTPLGPLDAWPQSLRTSVSTCLSCAFPIVLWWGPELVILYNEEYRAILGPAKHPGALGAPGAVVWSEIWDTIGPMLSQVMERGEATRSRDLLLHIDRGYPEEAYFSFSYSPIYGEDGKIRGIFCPVIETTEKIIGERRLRTLRDLAARCKGVDSEATVYQSAAEILRLNPYDVPFALIYRIDEGESFATLESAVGIEPGTPASPLRAELQTEAPAASSLDAVARSGTSLTLSDLSVHVDALPMGAWKVSPHTAVVLPVLLPGQERPRSIVVAGVSPMRALDQDHVTFFGLLATQIASGIADADAREEERRRAEALAAIDRAKTAFFSNVSHEFRTPLTLMLGPVQDVLADATLDRRDRERLEIAQRNTVRLSKLVNTLLDFSRIEAGRIDASYEPTDLSLLTTELASVFRSAIEKAGLALVVDCPPLPEPVYVDRDMWEKIVLNLYTSVQEANRIKDDFLASLSHELRTPLNAILGYARMLRTGTVAADRQPRAIETIERNATSLTQMVEDVLDISRIVSGKIRLDVQTVDLPDIVRSAVDGIAPAADAKGIRVESIVDPQASPISGDPERLQQILWNLLSNAVKFTNRGGKVQVRLERVNSHVEVSVSDTGIGITPEFLPHVFERFRQADPGTTHERRGLGLGLAIARQIAEMHGGTIDVSSAGVGRGSTFRVKLPLMVVHPVRDQEPRVHPRASATAIDSVSIDLSRIHVLAVDDEPDALALVSEVLQAAGARVTTAISGAEAIRVLETEPPDVLVTDLGMPGLDGFALIDRVRRHADDRVRQLPAAALTAYARSEDRMKALRAGFQMHLAKPIDPAELVTTVAALAKRFVQR